jgi:hypothetical protein
MVATSVFLPYEVYDLTVKVTLLRVGALVINLVLVAYLVWSKRLFGARGGKRAYEARLRTDSFIEVEQAALAAAQLAEQPTRPDEQPVLPPAPPAGPAEQPVLPPAPPARPAEQPVLPPPPPARPVLPSEQPTVPAERPVFLDAPRTAMLRVAPRPQAVPAEPAGPAPR